MRRLADLIEPPRPIGRNLVQMSCASAEIASITNRLPVEFEWGLINFINHLTGNDTMPTVQESDWPNQKHPSPPMRDWWG